MKLIAKKGGRSALGFTLVELMVAVAITVILLGIVFNVATVSVDTLNSAKNRVEMNKRAEIVLDQVEMDIASIILRSDDYEWFYAGPTLQPANNSTLIDGDFKFPNTVGMVFYTAAIDKYDGFSGTGTKDVQGDDMDRGGDVCMVNYMHEYTNPLASLDNTKGGDAEKQLQLMRFIKFPDESYRSIASDKNASAQDVWKQKYGLPPYGIDASLSGGVYGVSAVFELKYNDKDGNVRYHTVAITPDATLGNDDEFQATFLRISGKKGVITDCPKFLNLDGSPNTSFSNIKVVSLTYTITLLDEEGENYLRRVVGPNPKSAYMDQKELIKKHGRSFSRVINFP